MKPRFEIGTRFIRYNGTRKDVETIVDILTTRNHVGGIVKVRYVAVHEFLNNEVIDSEIPEATIARSEILEEEFGDVCPHGHPHPNYCDQSSCEERF